MDPFSDRVPSDEEDQDPAAAFIAQQRSQMAGLEDDFDQAGGDFSSYGDVNGQNGFVNGNDSLHDAGGYETRVTEGARSPFVQEPPKIRPATPEKIRKWREDQAEMLQKKDAAEQKKKEELRAHAQKELEDWYRLEADNIKKAIKNNRQAEKDFVYEENSGKAGEEWERISRLCDFNPKTAKGVKDVSRLRSIILQLKQDKQDKASA